MSTPVDILSAEYIRDANAELAEKPCPVCGVVGAASVAKRFVPSQNFSLAGAQAKLSGQFQLILSCRSCGVQARLYQ